MPRLFARGSDGTVCIHTGADDVVGNPYVDLTRVLFHSALLYPSVVYESGPWSVTLPALSSNDVRYSTYDVFAHGRPGTPFVLGYINNLSNVALAGSVPVDALSGGFGRFVTLGADATYVRLHEASVVTNGLSLDARELLITVFVTDLLL